MRSRPLATLLTLALVAGGAAAAGTVQVVFLQPDKFTDVGRASRDVDDNLGVLRRHFEAPAARHLADGQKLSIEVLDVDLAGELLPSIRRAGQEVRVLKGTVDWPRIKLRYTLESAGQPARVGERLLQDLAYLQHIGSSVGRYGLFHEQRLLDSWFAAEFGRAASP